MTHHPKSGFVIAALMLTVGCQRQRTGSLGDQGQQQIPESVKSEILSLDHRYAEAWRQGDWATVESLVAPDYEAIGEDFSWSLQNLREEFPKVKLLEYKNGPASLEALGPDTILLSYVTRMQETADGKDISGRYWYSQIWVRRAGAWRLLVEQEIPLRGPSS